jgi:hypothetical protein
LGFVASEHANGIDWTNNGGSDIDRDVIAAVNISFVLHGQPRKSQARVNGVQFMRSSLGTISMVSMLL